MKKVIALLIVAVMLLAVVPAVSVSAAAGDGDWIPVTSGGKEAGDPETAPLPGYKYTSKGFETISPSYKNYTVDQVVATRDTYDLRIENDEKGHHVLSLDLTVLEYAYGGEAVAKEDHWISFSIWDQQQPGQGSVENGNGYFCLIRYQHTACPDGFRVEQFLCYNGKWSAAGGAMGQDNNVTVEKDADGHDTFHFVLDKDASGSYSVSVNGCDHSAEMTADGVNTLDDVLGSFADKAYVSVKIQTGIPDQNCSFRIDKFNGEVPAGDDSGVAGENLKVFAELADSSTVPANMPCVVWDSSMKYTKSLKGSGIICSVNDDKTIHVVASGSNTWIDWTIPSEFSYKAEDFPVIAVMTKGLTDILQSGTLNCYYCADKVFQSKDGCVTNNLWADEAAFYGDWYLGLLNIADEAEEGVWQNRINALRLGANGVDLDEEGNAEYDIAFYGMFRSEEEAKAYAQAYMDELYKDVDTTPIETTAVETTKMIGIETEADETTVAGADVTTAAGAADTGAGTGAEETTAASGKKGCGGFVGGIALIAVVSLAGVCIKKKH